ncbi:MAG: nucleoside 2-deoxyribosyltransferase [Candidatus Marinimicrobia bacterium]|nr:nucleoside 2-deoxyribosyltransferase [Candidatus Neomarinimicrobiota bacterium]
MKIYFAGSIRGGREYVELYQKIITYLKKFGTVLTEHVADRGLSKFGENIENDISIHTRDMEWLYLSNVLVAEVTTPSLGVGYEIGRAIENNKPVLCLYKQGSNYKLSAMIAGCENLTLNEYSNIEQVQNYIDDFLNGIQ